MTIVLAHIVRSVRVEYSYAQFRSVRQHAVGNHCSGELLGVHAYGKFGFIRDCVGMKLVGRRACRNGGGDRCKHWFYVSVHALNLIIHLLQVRQVPNVL